MDKVFSQDPDRDQMMSAYRVSTRLVRRLAGNALRVSARERAFILDRCRGRRQGVAVKVAGLMCIAPGTVYKLLAGHRVDKE